jgi:DNA-binding GntR family transcriptional regulator
MVANRLRNEIVSGEYPAGTRLLQTSIAARYGVSTTPVREALVSLQSEGLVQLHPQRGATVFVPTVEDLAEHYEIRIALEMLAVRKAAERFLPEWAPSLTACLDEMATNPPEDRSVALNEQFHREIYERARRPRLVSLIAGLRDASSSYLHIYRAAPKYPQEHVDAEHRRILAACVARDPDEAAQATRDHLMRTVERVSAWLEAHPPRLAG